MKIDPRKPAAQPPADAKLNRAAAKKAIQSAVRLSRPAPKLEKAAADNTAVSVGVQRMRAIKRGGTGPLPWDLPTHPLPTAPDSAATKSLASVVAAAGGQPSTDRVNSLGVLQAEGKNTCAAANKQMAMAEHNPAQYRRMVAQLEAKGRAVLPSGEHLSLSAANRRYIDGLPGMTAQERENMKVQAALMDYANGGEDYDMESDLSIAESGATRKGLTPKQAQRLDKLDNTTETATPEELQNDVAASRNFFMRLIQSAFRQFGYDGPGFVSAVTDVVRQELERAQLEQRELAIALKWPGGDTPTHMVTVTGIDADGNVTVRDTERERTYSADDFADLLPQSDADDVGNTTTQAGTTSTPPPPPPSGGRKR